MKAQILAFAGPICSGKSVLSKCVAEKLSWGWVSFGDFLRDEAVHSAIDASSRTNLQDLGQTFIDKGWPSFCQNVLDYARWHGGMNLVIDGVRHVEAVQTLRKLTAPCRFTVIFVETPVAIRKARLAAREPGVSFDTVDSHPVEREAQTALMQLANYTVDGSLPVEEASMSVLGKFNPSDEA